MIPDPAGPTEDYGLGHAAGARRALSHLGAVLRPGETVRCAATAFLEGRSGLVAATTERLLFIHRSEILISSPYPEITRFRARIGVLTADLEVEDHNGRVVLRQTHPRRRLYELAGILHGRPDAPEPRAAPAPSPPPETGLLPEAPAAPPAPTDRVPRAPTPPAATGGRRSGRASGRPREPVALPAGGWLGAEEWLVTTFAATEVDVGAGRKLTANAAVTNQRLLLLDPSGSVVADWALGRVQPHGAASPMRVRLTNDVEFGFSSAEGAEQFSKALITAGFLASPLSGSGSEA